MPDRRGGTCAVCACPNLPWLRARTVADRLNLTEQQITRLLRMANLRGVKIGHVWRVDHDSLDAYVAAHMNTHDPHAAAYDAPNGRASA